jgi:hypothetical protein
MGRCVRLTTLPPSRAVVMKSGNLNFLEPSGPLQACNWTALPFRTCSVVRRTVKIIFKIWFHDIFDTRSILYFEFEICMICSVACNPSEVNYLEYKSSNLYFPLKGTLKNTLILFFLFIPLLSSFYVPALYYFMPSRNNSCRIFTVYCNKHNQHFTVTHNTDPFFCSAINLSSILFEASLCTLIISLFHMIEINFSH